MAGGIVSGVLKGLLSNLSSPVLNEFWLLWGVGEDKDKLQSNLETINAVLQDAERRQVNEMAVKDWLRKIKAAAHDAEDVLDEFRIEALRRKVENQEADCCGIPLEKVSNLINLPVFHIKMAHKMQKLRKNFEHIATERSLFHFTMGMVDIQPRISSARETCSKPELEVYGRDTEKANLIDLLIKSESQNGEDLSVIPIVGMGGLGKTTLAQLVYNDEQVVNHFKELRMWVYVSENFDVGKLLKEILESATKKKADQLSMELLQNRLQEELSGKRYFLVLDDVWNDNANEWYRLKALLTCGANGSKLLVTTRHDAVAKIMHAVPRPPLGILSNEESRNLFQKLANPPPMCVAIGQEMVEKCGGLPLAITTLGGLMSSKETVSEWESVRDSELWNSQDNGGRILPTLQVSYDNLTPSLKQCFSYCAVIPKGRSFVKHKLFRQWIALGFIHSDEENELLEEKAEGYFNELLQRSLFQDSYEKEYYKMHDLIHDLVRFVAEKECFIVEASMDTVPKETRHLTVQDDKWAREPENLEALKKCEKLRSLSFYAKPCFVDGGRCFVNACLSLTCLRVLDLYRQETISYLPNSIDKLKHLRYLDVSFTSITVLPETICNLHSLQTLIIMRYPPIRMLPKNMKRMISLRHIELDEYFPSQVYDSLSQEGIGKLTCLRILPTFVVGEKSGHGIEELKGLNQLCGEICIRRLNHVGNGECAREANLKAKKHLHSLELSWDDTAADREGNSEEVSWSSDDSTAADTQENSEEVSSDDGTAADREGNSEEVLENLEPHSRLKQLTVEKYMGMKFPNWMQMLTNLTGIRLLDCVRCEHLPPLWRLPFLESLILGGMSAVKYIVEFDGSDNSKNIFPCLKHIQFSEMLGLEGWSSQQEDGDGDEQGRERDEQVILQVLHSLWINDCPKLSRIPWLRHVSSLTSLRISKVGWDMIEIPASQSLRSLNLSDMQNLERWSVQEADDDDDGQMIFSSLRSLIIGDCPKLICLPPLLLPALEIFRISKSNEMLLEWAAGLVANYTSLSKHSIEGLSEVMHLPQELGPNHTGPHTLEIIKFPKLTSLSNQLENLLALKRLVIKGCNDLVLSLPDGLQQQRSPPPQNSLRVLEIINSCENQISLPGDGILLTSLRSLTIDSCGNLESISADMLQNLTSLNIKGCPKLWSISADMLQNLTSLEITGCPKLWSISADMLQNLTSLEITGCPKLWSSLVSLENLKSIKSLMISGCPVMTRLLGSMKNATSLTKLDIEDCPGMWSLPESVKNLKSLTQLEIVNCPGISSLPESIGDLTWLYRLVIRKCTGITTLPNGLKRLGNLKILMIFECPDLKRKLQFPKGQDWHKVAHVPYIVIDGLRRRQEEDGDRFIY